MIPFKPIDLNDKDAIASYTYPSHYLNCDFSFANMCSWSFFYESEFAIADGFLLIRFLIGQNGNKRRAYMPPVGTGDLRHAIRLLEENARADGQPLRILGVTPDVKNEIENAFPGQFAFLPETNFFDYIYLRHDLATLTGKKYQPKRNHINKFKKEYSYEYIPVTPDIIPLCLKVERRWYQANRTDENETDLWLEYRSIAFGLRYFDRLGLLGGAIAVDGQIVAFTYGSPINHNAFGVHIEKADMNYEGIFSLINREFAARIPEQYTYVNREEDLGIPGLRRAKQSYHPTFMLKKNTAIKKN
jgi:hypothetical protein